MSKDIVSLDMSEPRGKPKLELKDVVFAVKDVTEWYDLGLYLDLPDAILATIASHPDVEGHRRMMLSKWLQYDREATWEKLVSALLKMGKNVIAENIRRQFMGIVAQTTFNIKSTVDQEARKRK